MRLGLTLDMVTNTTKLPFLVATELGQAKEQFLCPVVGEVEPRLEQALCPASYVSYSYKTLRIGQIGIIPDFIFTNNGGFDGINIRLMDILQHRFNFISKIKDINPRPITRIKVVNIFHDPKQIAKS